MKASINHKKGKKDPEAPGFSVPDCLLLRACAEIPLDLSLVRSVQGEHEEEAANGQSPEGVSLCGIWVQAEIKVVELNDL